MASRLKIVFLFSLLGLLPSTCMAQAEKARNYKTFTFYVENDIFAGTDRQYTSGVKLTWISPDLTYYRENPQVPKWSYPLIRRLPFINKPGFQRAISISIGQNIYTPEDIKRRDLVKEDRPYAGITYLAIGFHSKSSRRMDTLEFDFGIVGRHSYAEDCQKVVHEWIDSAKPDGWDNQLKDEPVLEVVYERKWKLLHSGVGGGFGYDFIPHMGAGLGNVQIYANAGAGIRLGWNLPNDFGTSLIRPGCECNAATDERDPRFFPAYRKFGIHFFAAIDGQAVLRNIFLDGNTFRDSHSVAKKPFVASFITGIGIIVHRFKVSYAFVFKTREFKTQKDEQVFGTISLSVSY